ncbi:Serine/threonine-protein phosphatase 2A activator 2 [Mycoblastus sanguinarius]|nr:Serine/threonine-protein phosphatase 2A activator 2 [Mycoblastus sanguinarius]
MPSAIETPPATLPPKRFVPLSPERLNNLPRLVPRKKKASLPQNPLPVPETPVLPAPPAISTASFMEPTRRILSLHDHDLFLSSLTYSLILSFVFSISKSVADKKISSVPQTCTHSTVLEILSILDSVEETIVICPPADQDGSRFGNPAFRGFLDSISSQSRTWHERLGLECPNAISETSTYLHHCFGNQTRIDYGSGHELNFMIWLLCLNRLSLLPESTHPALGLVVFPRYIRLLRRLQSTYYLEPAGSHGVWGLDDYHFLPFLFGASQLLHHPYIRPLAIHNELVLEEEGDEYLYLDMVRFTMASKTVKGLKWTQPMLDDISGAKNWEKVEQGMRRMFVKEVLGKLPVMQHFLFGSLVPAVEGMSREEEAGVAPESEEREGGELAMEEDGAKHVHRDDAWGDCCGIKIPSTVAAAQEARKKGDSDRLRRVPFD